MVQGSLYQRCSLYNRLLNHRLFGVVLDLFRLRGTVHRVPDQGRHQSIRTHLPIMEFVWVAKGNFQHSNQGSMVTNGQDQQRPGSELPADCGFDPPVGVRVSR